MKFFCLVLSLVLVGCGGGKSLDNEQPAVPTKAEPSIAPVKKISTAKKEVDETADDAKEVLSSSELEKIISTPVESKTEPQTIKTKKQIMKDDKQKLDTLKTKWDDQLDVVMSTPRLMLSPEISKLQEARLNFKQAEIDKCLDLPKRQTTEAMDKLIKRINDYRNEGDIGSLVITLELKEYEQATKYYKHLSSQCIEMA